jgi:RNA polymerase sigma factor (sigma-70 family)
VIFDPTDRDSEPGDWRFDPNDANHAGWQERYTEFDRAHRADLESYVRVLARRRGLADSDQSPEAVAQVALAKAALRWPDIETMERPEAWLRRVAANLVRKADINRLSMVRAGRPTWDDQVREQRLQGARHRMNELVDLPAPGSVEDEVLERVDPSQLMRLIAALPPPQRSAMEMFYVQGYRAKEVAEALGCTPEKVASLLRSGRVVLARRLAVMDPELPGLVDAGTQRHRPSRSAMAAALAIVALFLFPAILMVFAGRDREPAPYWFEPVVSVVGATVAEILMGMLSLIAVSVLAGLCPFVVRFALCRLRTSRSDRGRGERT